MKIEGSASGSGSESGSISQMHGFADPDQDPHQNVMDPQHWCLVTADKKIKRGDEKAAFDTIW